MVVSHSSRLVFVRDSSDTKGSIAVARQNKRSMKVHWIIFGVGWLAIGSAQGGPRFVTDDPEPRPPGGWEVNVPVILEPRIDFARRVGTIVEW